MPAFNVATGEETAYLQTPPHLDRTPTSPWDDLFKVDRLQQSRRLYPAPGVNWMFSCARYEVVPGNPSATAGNKAAALADLHFMLRQNAKDKGGQPEDWVVIILTGQWMREFVGNPGDWIADPLGTVGYIDCAYAILPKANMPEPWDDLFKAHKPELKPHASNPATYCCPCGMSKLAYHALKPSQRKDCPIPPSDTPHIIQQDAIADKNTDTTVR